MKVTESSFNNDGREGTGRDVVVLVLAATVIIGAMIASIYYPYPDGKPIGFVSFVALWFREILLLIVPAFALVAISVIRILRLVKGGKNAL